jgi:alkylation response protein AidB-like acyl-CoA dehydrogenase
MRLLDMRIAEVAATLDRGDVPGAEAAITKVLLTQAEQTIAAAGLELLGAGALGAVAHQHPLVESYLYSRAASIYGGSAQIQRNIIGERILGLPRENEVPT